MFLLNPEKDTSTRRQRSNYFESSY